MVRWEDGARLAFRVTAAGATCTSCTPTHPVEVRAPGRRARRTGVGHVAPVVPSSPVISAIDNLSNRRTLAAVTPAEALADVRGYAGANRIRYTSHARLRMSQRGVAFADVRHALLTATVCKAQPEGTWKVESLDRSGDELTAVVALDDGVLVVTVF